MRFKYNFEFETNIPIGDLHHITENIVKLLPDSISDYSFTPKDDGFTLEGNSALSMIETDALISHLNVYYGKTGIGYTVKKVDSATSPFTTLNDRTVLSVHV
ncbi:hypothetical protein HNP86_001850 [Methanococcus maripaludis]|uniref:Uncharacterized protein n=1 Tax=Methanococcus maripaludis TaxID=39152 RepID=A0A7J9NWJ8_METMI|nr:hypothetical protein [Methanococcus maripaludis]MBA2851691.1 hypothetical protein [Methanococcus maripaludis]